MSGHISHEQKYLMYQKGELSLKKAWSIFKKHLGENHRTVGDCLYALGILNKH